MGMWIVILIVTLAVGMAGLIYLATRFMRFFPTGKWGKHEKWLRPLLGIVALSIVPVAAYLAFGVTNMIVIVIFLAFVWILCDLVAHVARPARQRASRGNKASQVPQELRAQEKAQEPAASQRVREPATAQEKKKKPHVYVTGLVAIALTILYLIGGYFQAHHIWEKYYRLGVDSSKQPLKIAMLADSHMGTTFHADRFAKELKRIEATEPDLLVICGDMIDDDTSYEDMLSSCEALGDFQAEYGVFFCYGNHDRGYNALGRGYDGDAFAKALTENGVHILEDEVYKLNTDYTLIGRADASVEQMGGQRKSMESLLEEVNPDSYTIVLDHQPNDYEEEAKAGVGLVLSGHTHGGQMFPINRIGELIGANDSTYGYERHDRTDFIVTSGIGSWAIQFKTGCRSEFVVVRLTPERGGAD